MKDGWLLREDGSSLCRDCAAPCSGFRPLSARTADDFLDA